MVATRTAGEKLVDGLEEAGLSTKRTIAGIAGSSKGKTPKKAKVAVASGVATGAAVAAVGAGLPAAAAAGVGGTVAVAADTPAMMKRAGTGKSDKKEVIIEKAEVAAATGAAVGVTSAVLGTGAAAAVAAGAGAALAVGAGAAVLAVGDRVNTSNEKVASGVATDVDRAISDAGKKAQKAGAAASSAARQATEATKQAVTSPKAQTMTAAVIDNTKQVTADAADAVANAVSTTVMQVKEASKNSSFAKGALAAGETAAAVATSIKGQAIAAGTAVHDAVVGEAKTKQSTLEKNK